MDDKHEKLTLLGRFRKFLKVNLIAGLLFLTPIAATFFLLRLTIGWLDQILLIIPSKFRPENFLPFPVPGLGLIILFFVLLFSGVFVRNYLGHKLVSLWERIIDYIPIVNKIYTAVKQLIDTIAKGTARDFKRVVLIEYPKENIFAMAYVTGIAMGELQEKTKRKMINVYVPTTPNPTSGFYLMVPEDETIPLDMTVEESFKLLMSGGIITPENKRTKGGS
ncbi:DUF502 domain-containing protein [Desulfonatronovibrio hydrogenovorans]|uniref:DUF502 domain-containing protein n=1 Tax=Desulfonatronovibrio hydrogenovorans TaxID=53245 RepID=UPI0004917AB1|nr:DUF502 domain-containing protein [Desulfonatronovibrio hydrogenovorans]